MSLSRNVAGFVANLRYEDLPPAVQDRPKGVILQAIISALVAHDAGEPEARRLASPPSSATWKLIRRPRK
jgi:hypothetical protein